MPLSSLERKAFRWLNDRLLDSISRAKFLLGQLQEYVEEISEIIRRLRQLSLELAELDPMAFPWAADQQNRSSPSSSSSELGQSIDAKHELIDEAHTELFRAGRSVALAFVEFEKEREKFTYHQKLLWRRRQIHLLRRISQLDSHPAEVVKMIREYMHEPRWMLGPREYRALVDAGTPPSPLLAEEVSDFCARMTHLRFIDILKCLARMSIRIFSGRGSIVASFVRLCIPDDCMRFEKRRSLFVKRELHRIALHAS